jgi:hypothetical protein
MWRSPPRRGKIKGRRVHACAVYNSPARQTPKWELGWEARERPVSAMSRYGSPDETSDL